MAYGRPAWRELVQVAIDQVKLAGTSELFERQSVGRLLDQLEAIARKPEGDLPDRLILVLGAAEDLANRLGVLDAIRSKMAEKIAEERQASRKKLTKGISVIGDQRSEDHEDNKANGGGWRRPVLAQLKLDKPGFESRAEPLQSAVQDLRINRYLTLNFDLEIEREFRHWFRCSGVVDRDPASSDDPRSAFERLCDFREEDRKELREGDSTVTYTDGTRRSVKSVSMNDRNIGELVNFALHPRSYDAQVFHLHGRCDKPRDMVLTEQDYQNTYLKTGEQQQTFEEALSAIFAGNEVLFIGVGMQEHDMMRPLRQFVSQDRKPDKAKQPVYALMEDRCDLKLDAAGIVDRASFERDVVRYCDETTNSARIDGEIAETPSMKDRIADNAKALELWTQYGVHIIYYGQQRLRTLRLLLKLVEHIASKATSQDNDDAPWKVAWAALRSRIQQAQDNDGLQALLPKGDLSRLTEWVSHLDLALANGRFFLLEDAEREAVAKFARRLEGEIRSRALTEALKDLARDRDTWWRDWRRIPESRRASYPLKTQESARRAQSEKKLENLATSPTGAPNTIEIVSRHRPSYRHLPHPFVNGSAQFEVVERLRELGKKLQEAPGNEKNSRPPELLYPHGERDGLRVLRCAIPRGGGKGALLHILQEFLTEEVAPGEETKLKTSDKTILQTIFPAPDGQSAMDYHNAFCVHLSFSMEFTSVIEALRRFFKQAVLQLMERRKHDLSKFLRAPDPEGAEDDHFFKQLRRFASAENAEIPPDDFKTLKTKPPSRKPGRTSWVMHQAFRERFINLVKPRERQPNRQQQQHRVDRLRHFMELYRDLGVWLDGVEENRVFICLSGLDQLCDAQGVARNPMFRAFFRLLSGCGRKRPDEAPEKMPLDLLLISGSPEAPTRYLSHEIPLANMEGLRGGAIAVNQFHHPSNTDFVLEKWPLLPPLALRERYWLTPQAPIRLTDMERDRFFERWSIRHAMLKLLEPDPPQSTRPANYPSFLKGQLDDSVALSTWVFGVARLRDEKQVPLTWTRRGKAKIPEHRGFADQESAEECARKLLMRLDDAAARAQMNGVLRAVFNQFRQWFPHSYALQENFRKHHVNRKKAFTEPFVGFSKLEPVIDLKASIEQLGGDEPSEAWKSYQVQLAHLVLQHLAAFPMPIEARILYGCPEVHDALLHDLRHRWRRAMSAVRDKERPGSAGHADALPDGQDIRDAARAMRWRSRELAMDELSDTLEALRQIGFVMRIDRKRSPTPDPEDLSTDDENTLHEWHARYTVHPQMRDFLAHHMRFFVPDRGERNYFQVSLFCDQPRDLPTPTQEHYKLFREIIDGQIGACQRTLWHFYQIKDAASTKLGAPKRLMFEARDGLSRSDKRRVLHGLSRRLTNSDGDFDKDLISIHAVPQRIRALYGLVRSGFSIGSISRLPRFEDDDAARDQPYESFRGWLRGLTNAAIGVDHQWHKILSVAGYRLDVHGRPVHVDGDDPIHIDLTDFCDGPEIGKDTQFTHEKPVYLPSRPLYRDEIGWLLNERGVISLVQGHLFDALPLFERALQVMRHAVNGSSDDPALHAATRRVRLNLAIANIDRANLFRARKIIEDLKLPEGFSKHSGSTVSWIGIGYLGLIDHISGHYQSAVRNYEETIANANRRHMLRLVSIFNRHLADLYRSMGQFDKARDAVKLAISASMQSEQRDILHAARLSEVKIQLDAGDTQHKTDAIESCLTFAEEMGVPRLETEALRVQATIMLARGERVMAGQVSAKAAAVAARAGLRLHKVSALNVYADALRARQQFALSEDVQNEARAEAERLGFQIRAGGFTVNHAAAEPS